MQQVSKQRRGKGNRKRDPTHTHNCILTLTDYLGNINKNLQFYFSFIKIEKLKSKLTIQ